MSHRTLTAEGLVAGYERVEILHGVSVEGCKYPLSHATLRRSLQFAVSNEITGNAALVSCKKGSLYVIESADRR